jgi:hypothetical protein
MNAMVFPAFQPGVSLKRFQPDCQVETGSWPIHSLAAHLRRTGCGCIDKTGPFPHTGEPLQENISFQTPGLRLDRCEPGRSEDVPVIRPIARALGLCLGTALFAVASLHAGAIDSVRDTVESWRSAWQSRDLAQYMAHYHPGFKSDGLDREQWKQKKTSIFKDSGRLEIRVEDLWITVGNRLAVARFLQHYQSRNWSEVGEKELTLARIGQRWRIVGEQWYPLAGDRPDPPPAVPPVKKGGEQPHPMAPVPTPPERRSGLIRFLVKKESEKVFIGLAHYFIPMVFATGGEEPKIVVDIQGVNRWEGDANIPVNGRLIQRIRSYLHRGNPGKLRIVLDLNTAEDLVLNQTYLKAENIHCIELRQAKPHPRQPDSG